MKIQKGTEFAKFLAELAREEEAESISGVDELDLLDYHWLLVSILETIEEELTMEILDDKTGEYARYKVLAGEIDDKEKNKFCLELSEIGGANRKHTRCFVALSVKDARLATAHKYYVKTPDNKYRLTMYTQKNI